MKTFRSLRLAQRARPQLVRHRRPLQSPFLLPFRLFHASSALQRIETHILSDIGEGVKEVQIIQWFIEEGAAVEEWAPLCEVQSDKASVEITSKYTGVVKKLHFDRDAIVQVGDAMLDIEVEGEADAEEDAESKEEAKEVAAEEQEEAREEAGQPKQENLDEQPEQSETKQEKSEPQSETRSQPKPPGKAASLATPAVRGLLKEHKLDILSIQGSGKDGRVLKEDVFKHLEEGKTSTSATSSSAPATPAPTIDSKQTETAQNLTPTQNAMFKSMTRSLNIPHFLYSDSVNVTQLGAMRKRLNETRNPETTPKFSYMPFVLKAVSLALNRYPILNARIDTSTDPNKPKIMLRSNHNIGMAMDTPAGLLVPVIKSVNARSITSIAQEIQRLAELGKAGKLSNNDLSSGTITVSNIGNIGGDVVAPVIVEGQLAIMGMGKVKPTPVFAADGQSLERADMMSTSWSADHRVIDGATMARMAKVVQDYLERPETMIVDMS